MYSDLKKICCTENNSTFDRFYTFTVEANTVAGSVLFLKDCLVVNDSCFNLGGMHECTPAAAVQSRRCGGMGRTVLVTTSITVPSHAC